MEIKSKDQTVIDLYVHADVDAAVIEKFKGLATVYPHFRDYAYKIGQDTSDQITNEFYTIVTKANLLAEDLKNIPSTQDNIWLWPTLLGYQLFALGMVAPKCQVHACIHFEKYFQFPFLGKSIWHYAFNHVKAAQTNIKIGVTTKELLWQFQKLTTYPIEVLPVNHGFDADRVQRKKLRKIGFFGHQHKRKGISMLPGLVKSLLISGYEIVIQDSGNVITGEVGAKQDRIALLPYVDDFAKAMSPCDLIVMPYQKESYRFMGSGILWEAVASGIPVVVPAHTTLANIIEETGGGVCFDFETIDSVLDAIDRASKNYDQIAKDAYDSSAVWLQTNGVKKFVEKFLSM